MRLRLGAIALLAVVTSAGADALAQEPGKDKPAVPAFLRGDHHLIFRVETELQRLLIRPLDARIVVVLDGGRLREPHDVDGALIEAIRRDLAGFARRGEAVHFILFFGKDSPHIDPRGMKAALARLTDTLDLAHYPSHIASTFDFRTWRERVASVDDLPDTTGRDEAGVGDPSLKVYPVRTPLGRYLSEGNDCVIDVTSSVTEPNRAATLDAVRAGVPRLGLHKKRGFLVRFRNPPSKDLTKDLEHLRKDLGFQSFSSSCCFD